MENRSDKLDAFREIKHVIANIPPGLNKKELETKLSSDDSFRKQLTNRLIRLFGLRIECIPFIEPEFVAFADKAKLLVTSMEDKLTNEYNERLK